MFTDRLNPERAALPALPVDAGVWMAGLSATAFAAKSVLVKVIYGYGVDPLTLLCLRMALCLPIFLVIASRGPPIPRRDRWALLVLGAMGYYASALLDFEGLARIPAGLERLVLFTHPTLVLLLGRVWLGRATPPGLPLGIALSWAGIGLAMWPELHAERLAASAPGTVLTGVGLVAVSALSYAIYLLKGGELMARLGGMRVSAIATSVGTGLLLGHLGARGGLGGLLSLPLEVYGLGLLLALGSTVLPVLLLGAAIARIGPARSSAIGMIGPVITLGLGWALLGEEVGAGQAAGAALVMAAVSLTARGR